MRKLLLALILIFRITYGYSQDYVDTIAGVACKCLDKIPDTISREQYNIKLGLCILEASEPYRSQLKKDYDLDLSKIQYQGEQLGKIIGIRLASICPNILVRLSEKINKPDDSEDQEKIMKGEVTKIESDYFVIFYLKDDAGKVSKFYWLNYIESEYDLPNKYKSLLGKSIKVTYKVEDIFDPKLGEYRPFYTILKINQN